MEMSSLGICARTAHPQMRVFACLQLSWKILEGTHPPKDRLKLYHRLLVLHLSVERESDF